MSRFGYVHSDGTVRVFWGVATVDPDAGEVADFASRDQPSAAGAFNFAETGGYLYVALPVSFGIVEQFYFDGMPVVFTRSDVTVLVDLTPVDYYLYKSPEITNADNVTLTVPAA